VDAPRSLLSCCNKASSSPSSWFTASDDSLRWRWDARRYPAIATTTDTNATNSNVQTSWSVPLLYSMQYRLGVSQVREKVTVCLLLLFPKERGEREKRIDRNETNERNKELSGYDRSYGSAAWAVSRDARSLVCRPWSVVLVH